jgi:glycerophosphoryl diester phosphodiesterase
MKPLLPSIAICLALVSGCAARKYLDTAQSFDRSLVDCPAPTKHSRAVDTFLVIGHRGAAALAVENTIPSMEIAVAKEGANAVEVDVSLTADGHVVLWHDWDPNSMIALAREQGLEPTVMFRPMFPLPNTGRRLPVDQVTLKELRESYGYSLKDTLKAPVRVDATIPTFEELVRWAASRPALRYLFIDVKAPGEAPASAEKMIASMEGILRSIPHAFTAVYLTPYDSVHTVIASAVAGGNLSFDVDLPGGVVTSPCTINSATMARRARTRFASTVHPFTTTVLPWTTMMALLSCDLELRDHVAADGTPSSLEKVVAATINEPRSMECLINLGVDGLITDNPRTLRGVAERLGKVVR